MKYKQKWQDVTDNSDAIAERRRFKQRSAKKIAD